MADGEEIDEGGLLLIAPQGEDGGELEALRAGLGMEVVALEAADPALDPTGARAVVVEWDLGARTGLDLVESLVRDPRLRGVPIALCSHTPTRARVAAALRAGAKSFLHRPLEAGELSARLGLEAGTPGGDPPESNAEPEPAPAPESKPEPKPESEPESKPESGSESGSVEEET
ncbi:MAG: hypothetical protein ACQGVK_01700 [Myxococcota bacterium]